MKTDDLPSYRSLSHDSIELKGLSYLFYTIRTQAISRQCHNNELIFPSVAIIHDAKESDWDWVWFNNFQSFENTIMLHWPNVL